MHRPKDTIHVERPFRAARSKIVPADELPAAVERARAGGKTVVMAHGVFDLLHMGHVRHLEEARLEGDILVVSITADRFVNKGPDRPVFSEPLRAEMLAALEYVDFVTVNHAPSAEDILRAVRPDIYVKGSDYVNAAEDVTGKIDTERQAVEEGGGRIVFTHDITFSSSSLINRYLNIYDQTLQGYLESARERGLAAQAAAALNKVGGLKVLLIGDAIIDEYNYVAPMGRSSKEAIVTTLHKGVERFAGGVFATANHVAGICDSIDIISCLGSADSHEDLILELLKPNISLHTIWRDGVPTTRKARYIDGASMRKLFEVYWMDDAHLPLPEETAFNERLERTLGDYDVVIVNDFGHGLIAPSTIEVLCRHARFLAVNVQANGGNFGFNLITKYRRADFICIDSMEARLATHDKFGDIADLITRQLPERIDCSKIIVTLGSQGCLAIERGQGLWRVPALTSTIVDTVGAGDAFFAITAPLVAAGVPMEVVGLIGNAAGALKVGIVGHRSSVEKPSLIKFITALLK